MRILAVVLALCMLAACGAEDAAPAAVAAIPDEPKLDSMTTDGLPPRVFGEGTLRVAPGGFDLGMVDPNTLHGVRMTLTNRAAEPLTIVLTASDCKCTLPEKLDGTVIAPGASIPMEATFQSRTSPGIKEAKVQVSYRVGQQPIRHAVVMIKGEVIMAVRAVPAYVDALKGVTTGTVRVTSTDKRPFRIISAGGEPPRFGDGFNPDRDEPRTEYAVRWEVRYPQRQEDCGGERLWWIVETDHPDCPVLPLRIRHECTGMLMDRTYNERGWMFRNYMVNAGAVRAGEPIDLDVDVKRLQQRATTGIYGAESLTPDATVEYLDIMDLPDDQTTVRVRFTPRSGLEGLLYAMANIKSAGGDKEIAIVARVLP